MKKSIKLVSSVFMTLLLLLSFARGAYEGVVAHSTATPEAPAINIQKYETRTWRNAFVHYAVDWNETIQIGDTKYIAYGGGPGA
ncbi:N-acetylmuramoyl-L-alanine amidase, partial [Bacillus pseudomycoides]|nr:N-acetylmuramoyl-L-alanine amidase [Bacillus pseudomycoides]